jgi:UDP-4-amino-4,6-dideoxy-L-N-acetyl-beta-L-altrosamine transaminase
MTSILPYAHQSIDESDIQAVTKAMRENLITRGPTVAQFEKAVCNYVQAEYAVAFVNGSAALYAAFQAAGVSSSDKTITSPNTFIATAAAGARLNSRVSFVDIDAFGNADVTQMVQQAAQPLSRGRSILAPVHFAGVAVDMKLLYDQLTVPDVVIIEDASHALGSCYPSGEMVGSCAFSDMTIFSFHASKNITCGEGGMVTTNDARLYEKLKTMRDSGLYHKKDCFWEYDCVELSCNYHMNEMQAALGISQLDRIEQFCSRKRELVSLYRDLLSHIPGVTLSGDSPDPRTHYHLFVVKIDFESLGTSREKVMKGLLSLGIQTQYHYIPLYAHSGLQKYSSFLEIDFPMMKEHSKKALTLPLFSSMTNDDVIRVVTALQKVLFFSQRP